MRSLLRLAFLFGGFLSGTALLNPFHGFAQDPGDPSPLNNQASPQPNIVLINVDDADREMFRPEILEERFPNISSLARNGITFTNFHVTSPLCGPSRACLMRGQYAHALKHRTNDADGWATRGFEGDFGSYDEQGYFDDDFGTWMKLAGYHTIFVGKHVNFANSENRIPAGWDDFYRSQGSRYYHTYRFTNRSNPQGAVEQLVPGVYRTNAEASDIVHLIRQNEGSAEPLFVYFAPFGPHTEGKAKGGMVDTAFENLWQNIPLPQAADFDEDDISDKPPAYQQLPRLSNQTLEQLDDDYRDRMLAMKSIDIAVGRIIKSLHDTGRLSNTYIFFTSDNGYSLGQHRMAGKGNTLTKSSHVPMIVSGPQVESSSTANHLLGHIDLAPTFLQLAGAEPKAFFDGKSFKALIDGPDAVEPDQWRSDLLIENWQSRRYQRRILPTTFNQLRMYDSVYTEWADGSREYYDLAVDPLELENRAGLLTDDQKADFSNRLQAHKRPMPQPLATVERPPRNNSPISGPPFVVRGVAEDSSRIDRVDLVIRRWSTREFWNGSQWQSNRIVLRTILGNPGGMQTEWTYRFNAPQPDSPKEGYSVIPRAYAGNGNYTRQVVVRKFQFDSFPPVTVLNNLRVTPGDRARIIGRARDNYKVQEVRLLLQNQDTNEYFDGENWGSARRHIVLSLDDDDKFDFMTPELPFGGYLVRLRAYDAAGNWDETPATQTFSIPGS